MKDNIRSRKLFGIIPVITFAGIVLGAIGGYAYYYYIGCRNGSCAITSNPWLSILWGAAIGYLLFDMFTRNPKKEEPKNGPSEVTGDDGSQDGQPGISGKSDS